MWPPAEFRGSLARRCLATVYRRQPDAPAPVTQWPSVFSPCGWPLDQTPLDAPRLREAPNATALRHSVTVWGKMSDAEAEVDPC
ncbi:hypothetical protein MHYP_G00132140 [Metynnis hypsauchen]